MKSSAPDAFNLVTAPWIPVLRSDGRCERVGIRQALAEAEDIRQIGAENPMDRFAILRFLLSVVYWCGGNPAEESGDATLLDGGAFPSGWLRKLDAHRELFNLLGNGPRFYQSTNSRTRPQQHTTNYLIHEVPSGSNKWHFRHTTDFTAGLCPSCCAAGLVRLPVFATSGGKGKSPGINARPPTYMLPVGGSLRETLSFCWRPYDGELGAPEWEAPTSTLPSKGPVPLLTAMTWLPRSVWLGDPEGPPAPCAACGRMEVLIRHCVFDGKGTSKAEGRSWRDPHVLYEDVGDGKELPLPVSDALGSSDAAAGQWARRFAAVMRTRRLVPGASIWLVGFSTVQNDKYLEAMECLLPPGWAIGHVSASPDMLDSSRKDGARLKDRVDRILRGTEDRAGRKDPKKALATVAIAAVRPQAEVVACQQVARTADPTCLMSETWTGAYPQLMRSVAGCVAPGFTTHALHRRRQIGGTLPNTHPGPAVRPVKARASKESRP